VQTTAEPEIVQLVSARALPGATRAAAAIAASAAHTTPKPE
jgi:hypothetical protein